MIQNEIKYYLFELLVSIIFIILGYSSNSLQCFGIGLFIITISTISFVINVIRIKLKYKNVDRNKIENDIKNSIYKFDNVIFTNDYIYLYDSFSKIYYKEIIVIDITPSFIFKSRISSVAYKYSIYLKNGKKYYFKRNWQDQIDDDIKKIIIKKNPKVYFGKYKDYKKIHIIK